MRALHPLCTPRTHGSSSASRPPPRLTTHHRPPHRLRLCRLIALPTTSYSTSATNSLLHILWCKTPIAPPPLPVRTHLLATLFNVPGCARPPKCHGCRHTRCAAGAHRTDAVVHARPPVRAAAHPSPSPAAPPPPTHRGQHTTRSWSAEQAGVHLEQVPPMWQCLPMACFISLLNYVYCSPPYHFWNAKTCFFGLATFLDVPLLTRDVDFGTRELLDDSAAGQWTSVTQKTARTHTSESTVNRATREMSRDEIETLARRYQAMADQALAAVSRMPEGKVNQGTDTPD
ncbi:hypothetical protein GGX14DRAFT_575876 [Mycena pura]|uniref:Uncharacterized protein n=1 Tax=Mycena pura TaxID=153505 RepID=A0AAD6UUJ9_9AGAR|nr:hypothetical protein GGX14DRAFT_575876 [Mycena pura]